VLLWKALFFGNDFFASKIKEKTEKHKNKQLLSGFDDTQKYSEFAR